MTTKKPHDCFCCTLLQAILFSAIALSFVALVIDYAEMRHHVSELTRNARENTIQLARSDAKVSSLWYAERKRNPKFNTGISYYYSSPDNSGFINVAPGDNQ